MDGKDKPRTNETEEELPRGELSKYTVSEGLRVSRQSVELAGALWDVEFDYLTLSQYTSTVSVVQPSERTLAVAKLMNPTLNGEVVDWDNIAPLLGMKLQKYLDVQLSLPPTKNY